MAAAVNFFADDYHIQNLNGSGLGFYGSNFGYSVGVGEYQDTTFITDGTGSVEGQQLNNIKWAHPASGSINGASEVNLNQIPNYLATLNIRFTNDTAVQIDTCRLYIYDRTNKDNPASGVTTKVAEIIHPDIVQNANGSGDTTWITNPGSGTIMTLAQSPGMSGMYAGGGASSVRPDTQHDLYLAISQSPDSIGSKTLNGLYFSVSYF
jgi:hypothetical protein